MISLKEKTTPQENARTPRSLSVRAETKAPRPCEVHKVKATTQILQRLTLVACPTTSKIYICTKNWIR